MSTHAKRDERLVVDEILDGSPPPSQHELPAGYALEVVERQNRGTLRLRAPDGTLCLTIRLDETGPHLEVSAASVAVSAEKSLRMSCENLEVFAEKNISMRARGTFETEGFDQLIRATTGDIHVHANDDVRVDGERIHLNSPYTHRSPRVPVGESKPARGEG